MERYRTKEWLLNPATADLKERLLRRQAELKDNIVASIAGDDQKVTTMGYGRLREQVEFFDELFADPPEVKSE